jgi:glycerol-3-phosphate dehydrogenase
MYEREELKTDQGLANLREFFRARWKGERPVLWDRQLAQAELKEAIYCGLLDLELWTTADREN